MTRSRGFAYLKIGKRKSDTRGWHALVTAGLGPVGLKLGDFERNSLKKSSGQGRGDGWC